MKKIIAFTLLLIIVLASTTVLAAGDSQYYIDGDSIRLINEPDSRTKILSTTSTDLAARSYPDIFSTNTQSTWFWFRIIDSENNAVTGIKISRIEIIQGSTVVARANDIESRSISGNYDTNELEFIDSFNNENGENLVDIVAYLGSKEVARIENHVFEVYSKPFVQNVYANAGIESTKFSVELDLINVSESDVVDAYVLDDSNVKVAEIEKVLDDYYDYWDNARWLNFGMSFNDISSIDTYQEYRLVVTVNDEEMQLKEYDQTLYVETEPDVNTIWHASLPELEFEVNGVNLLNNGPYSLEIKQGNNITKEINDVEAYFDEETYSEVVLVPLHEEYFSSYGDMYSVTMYDSERNILLDAFDFLEPIDDTSDEVDAVDQFENFKVFDSQSNIEPSKTWRISFNKPLNVASINMANVYVFDKTTKLSVDVDYKFESDNSVIAMTPSEDFEPGETYYLIIIDRVIASDGTRLNKPTVMEFTIKDYK